MTKIDFSEYFAETCPTPGKARYVDEMKALRALDMVQRFGKTTVKPTRVYLCECGWWHMTAKEERK